MTTITNVSQPPNYFPGVTITTKGAFLNTASGAAIIVAADTTGVVAQLATNLTSPTFSEFTDVADISIDAAGNITLATGIPPSGTRTLNARVVGNYDGAVYRIDKSFTITAAGIVINSAPVWSSATTASVSEGVATSFYNCAATDAEGGTVTYSIVGGADAALFTLTGTALRFTVARDYETPTDTGTNNVYNVTLRASDGVNNTDLSLAVTVTNVLEQTLSGVGLTMGTLNTTLAAGALIGNITGRISGDDIALSGTHASQFVLNGAKTQVLVGISDITSIGNRSIILTQSHPDAPSSNAQSFTVAITSSGSVPVKISDPTLSSTTPTVGDVITVSYAFTGSPTSYTFVWKRNGTVIPNAVSSSLFVPAIAATEAITCEVVAINGAGGSLTATTAASTAVARAYADATTLTNASALFSHTLGVRNGYAGNLVTLNYNGTTASFGMNSKGILDIPTVIAWWVSHGGVYSGGLYQGKMPRVTGVLNQLAVNSTAKLQNATLNNCPFLDFNLVQDDGLIPISFNGYSGAGSDIAGTAFSAGASTEETNTFLYVTNTGSTGIPYDSSNHGIVMVLEGASSAGTGAQASGIAWQNAVAGFKGTTQADNTTIALGNCTLVSKVGLGISQNCSASTGLVVDALATPLLLPNSRCVLMETQTCNTGNTIDGLTPAAIGGGTNSVMSIVVDNDFTNKKRTFAGTLPRNSNTGSANGLSINRNACQKATSNTTQAFYGAIVYGTTPLVTGTGGSIVDNRAAASDCMMKLFGVNPTPVTTNVTVFGASSAVGYAGTAGGSFINRAKRILGDKVSFTVVAVSGASNYYTTAANQLISLQQNKTYLATLKEPGKKNIAVVYCASSDIGGQLRNGDDTWMYQAEFVDALYNAGWEVCVATFVPPAFETGAGTGIRDATKVANQTRYNDLVMDPVEMATHHYSGISIHTATELQDPLGPLYFDAGTHVRTFNGHQFMATALAAGLQSHIAP